MDRLMSEIPAWILILNLCWFAIVLIINNIYNSHERKALYRWIDDVVNKNVTLLEQKNNILRSVK